MAVTWKQTIGPKDIYFFLRDTLMYMSWRKEHRMSSPARQMNGRRLPPLPAVRMPGLSPSNPIATRGTSPKVGRRGLSASSRLKQPIKVSRGDMLIRGMVLAADRNVFWEVDVLRELIIYFFSTG